MLVSPLPPLSVERPGDAALRKQSQALESAFLSEMLAHAGLGQGDSSFDGGIGEQQFASFLRNEQAGLMVARGGIGLAEKLFRAMRGADDYAE